VRPRQSRPPVGSIPTTGKVSDAICSAAGLLHDPSSGEQIVTANYLTTQVEVVPQMLANADAVSIGRGAPLRGIAPCGACHGEVGTKAGAAWLEGQPVIYLRIQLEAFASGARHNDIDEQMRNVARAMSAQEIDAAARYYAEHP
jgi:cytochrome c553